MLDTGVDSKALGDHADPGYDAVDRDRDPKPGARPERSDRRETSGTALASIVAAAGERVLPIRIASLRAAGGAAEAASTTDQIIAGLEHAVDPNGDQDTSDHVPVALIGVNAPYAGFAKTPEAQAIRGAAGLGHADVAPAGNEGAAAPGSGTIGSPGERARRAGGRRAGRPGARAAHRASRPAATRSPRPRCSPASRRRPARPPGPVEEHRPGEARRRTAIRGKVVIVRAGANPAAQAAAAAAVGAAAVLLAQPQGRAAARRCSAGRAAAPVIGVTGDAADDVLKLKPGTDVTFGASQRGAEVREHTAPHVSPNSPPRGRRAGGLPKPDVAAPSSALTVAGVTGGTAVAAAQVAVAGRPVRPRAPRALAAAAARRADRRRRPGRTSRPTAPAPGSPATPTHGITADPPTQESGALDPISVELIATKSTQVTLRATGGATAAPRIAHAHPGRARRGHRPPAQAGHDHRPARGAQRQHGRRVRPVADPPRRGRADRRSARCRSTATAAASASRSARSNAARRPPSRSPSSSILDLVDAQAAASSARSRSPAAPAS